MLPGKDLMADAQAKQEVTLLLRDYMNILPPGPQTAYVPAGTTYGDEGGWPITPELERRMDKGTLTGDTYALLDDALVELNKDEPELYNALLKVYLHPEAGHSDLDFIKRQAAAHDSNSGHVLAEQVDNGIEWVANYLANSDLYVRWPQTAPLQGASTDMSERHSELYAVYKRNRASGQKHSQAVTNAALKLDYSRRRAQDIIKGRQDDEKDNE